MLQRLFARFRRKPDPPQCVSRKEYDRLRIAFLTAVQHLEWLRDVVRDETNDYAILAGVSDEPGSAAGRDFVEILRRFTEQADDDIRTAREALGLEPGERIV